MLKEWQNNIKNRFRVLLKTAKKPKKIYKIALYFSFSAITLFWLSFGVNKYWMENTDNTAAQNHALAISARNKIRQLQSLLDPQNDTFELAAGNFNLSCSKPVSLELGSASFFRHGFSSLKIGSLNRKTQDSIGEINSYICETSKLLDGLKKFILYDPEADLEPYLSGGDSSNERITQTSNGIAQIADNIKALNIEPSKYISGLLQTASTQAKNITAETAEQWFKETDQTKTDILTTINNYNAKVMNKHDASLTGSAEDYLELRTK